MHTIRTDSGFSLIELIVSLVILIVIFGLIFPVLTGYKLSNARMELNTKAIFIAEQLMQEILSKQYDENGTSPWTSTASFGGDLDDVTRDDIDDYAGYTNSSISGFPGFTESVRVFYVSPAVLNDSVNAATDIKKIMVTVTHSEIEPVILQTIMSSHY